jgi:hypothetical protein
VVSLQNYFQKSNDGQNSDLGKFNSSKFVHVSSLKTYDSRVFYKFQGIHRLQICSNWIYRTKVMNFMVFISHFAILFFPSKLCTVPLWFLSIFVFYTLQGFQGYLICNFWTSILFYNDFTSCSRNLEFENWIQTSFDSVDQGGWRGWSMWPLLIGLYRFGMEYNMEHWI